MLRFLPGHLNGIVTLLLISSYTAVLGIPLFLISFIRFIIPLKPVQRFCTWIALGIATIWVDLNNFVVDQTSRITWDVEIDGDLNTSGWYLVLSNHQSWVDIVVLNRIFNHRIPFLRYFLKQELIWVPVLSMAWVALDFPFMKRYSKEYLKKHPHLMGKDMEITKKACEKFKHSPVSIMNFVEGTRLTPEKYAAQEPPYKHLLLPRAGGIAFALDAMGPVMNKLVDVTLYYPRGVKSFWHFLCGQVTHIVARIRVLPIPESLYGDYQNDSAFAEHFKSWLNDFWAEKDNNLEMLKNSDLAV